MEEKSVYEELIENAKYFKDKDGKLNEKAYNEYLKRNLVNMCNFALKYMGISKEELKKKARYMEKTKRF